MLEVNDLTVRYGDLTIVNHLSLTVEEGQWLMIVGPNGAGKSTALNAITRGVDYRGQVLFRGRDVRRLKPAELARCMGVLMQNHFVSYSFSVEEVVGLGRYAYDSGFLHGGSQGDRDAVEAALRLTGMAEQRHQSVLTLSGGELQRTFLAQLFAQDPQLLLLDEPTNHLDLVYQKQVFNLIRQWLQAPGRAVVSVVHDLSLARAYGTQALLMNHGKAVAHGTIREVFTGANLDAVYGMDVYGWMRGMLEQWL